MNLIIAIYSSLKKQQFAIRLFAIFYFLLLTSNLSAQQLAFPGAEGGGRFAVGGRGGTVYEVTNLNDAGAGSLRDAVSQANRTVIFKVSGIIQLKSKLVIQKNNITIAGQTAPGDGICITGYTLNIKANDIIIRYIRCRLSDINDVEDDAMNSFSGSYQNIIIDHCSLGWSVDETGTFYDIKNFTLQWCMLTESLYHSVHEKGNHGYGGIWGGENASFHHNLLAHHVSRNPRFCGSRFTGHPEREIVDFRNNVIYNWGNGNSTYGGEGGNYNMVNNYYKPGPATPGNTTTSSTSNKRNRILNYTSYYTGSDAIPDTVWGGKFYIDGNYVYGYPDVTADNWTKGVQKDSYTKAPQLILAAKQSVPFSTPPVTTQTAEDAYISVLENVGAYLPKRDTLDRRIIKEVKTGTATYEGVGYSTVTGTGISHPSGIIDTQTDVGGLPEYKSRTPLNDTDHDGMPDNWEVTRGLNPNDAADRNLPGTDGYTNLENYLSSINGPLPGFTISGATKSFAQITGTPSAIQTYTISGEGLTGNIIITPPLNYEVSANSGTTWFNNASPLMLTQTNGKVASTTISVRLNAGVPGMYSGNITHESTDVATANALVSGITSPKVDPPAGTAVVVAKDGSGNFTTIQAAINAAPTGRTMPYIIFIRNGKYKEKINIPSNKPFIQLVGESVANTILTYDDYSGKPMPGGGTYGTSTSASVTVNATDFSAVNITFENSTGDAPQALAINVNADRVSFKNCRFLGGQDTVLTNLKNSRNYFKNCYIDGVVDFIFGSAIAVFDSCIIYPKSRSDGNGSYLTAANTPGGQAYGYVFRNCIMPSNTGVTSYVLGRPWQNSCGSIPVSFPKVVFLNTKMGYTIKPEGWATWDACTKTDSIYYGEYKTRKINGNLADISKRVAWSHQLTDGEAATYTNANIFGAWDPCAVFSDCLSASPIAVSNFRGKKGASTTAFTWNISWPIAQVKYELYRSSDKVSFSKINEQISPNDTAVNYTYSEAVPAPGVTYYYYILASKPGMDFHVTDTVKISSTPTITTTGSLSNFIQGLGLPSAKQGYTITGVNLTNDITVTPPAGYEISPNGGTTWYNNTAPLTLAQSGGNVTATTISVRLNAGTPGSYSGNIIHTSPDAATANIAVNGNVQADPLPVSVTLLYWPFVKNNSDSTLFRAAGVANSKTTLNRLYLSNGGILTAYSANLGQVMGPSSNGDGTWTAAAGGSGSSLTRTLYEQFTVKALPGYSVKVDSFLIKSSFYATASSTKMAIVYSKSNFVSDSTDVTGGTGPGGPLLSTANGTFATPILVLQENGSTTQNYRLALSGAEGITITENQTLTIRVYLSCGSTSTGRYAKFKDVYIKGGTKKLPQISVAGTLNAFTQTVGAASDIQTYTILGNSLTDNIVITSPSSYEISSDGGTTWTTSATPLFLTPANGSVASTTVSVRLNAGVAGNYSGDIVNSSSGATPVKIAVTGMTSAPITPPTGIEEDFLSNRLNLTISPNPTDKMLTIYHTGIQSKSNIRIYDPIGIKQISFTTEPNTASSSFDISSLKKGMYILEFVNGKKRVMRRIIKE